MKIYLKKIETNEVIEVFENVTNWGVNFVEFLNNGYEGKIYCDEEEYFTNSEENENS